jgi:hypothetical protein
MKTRGFIVVVILLMTGLVLTGFNIDIDKNVKDYQDKDKQAGQGLKKEKTGFDQEWKEFKSNAELKIAANEKKIDEFKVKVRSAGKDLKTAYNKEVVVLEQKNAGLKEKIKDFKFESKDKWVEFKQGFNRDMDVVGKALKDLFSKKD